MSELKASIVVDFGDALDSDGILKAEFYNDINPPSPFRLIDEVNFLVFKSKNVYYNTPLLSSGIVTPKGSATVEKEQEFSITDETPVDLSYDPDGDVTFLWYGNEPTVMKDDDGKYVFTAQDADSDYPFIGKATYKTTGDNFLLTPPTLADDVLEHKILILITGDINA